MPRITIQQLHQLLLEETAMQSAVRRIALRTDDGVRFTASATALNVLIRLFVVCQAISKTLEFAIGSRPAPGSRQPSAPAALYPS
jgi:hypothetical protein